MNTENKLIAEFMGVNIITIDDVRKNKNPYISSADGYLEDDIKYHSSWDWLMPVISKITKDERYIENEYRESIMDVTPYGNKEDAIKTVVEFIKWHNENLIG